MLVFSDEMAERLTDLERAEPVARYLLMPWADNPDGPNYFDLGQKPGMVTYVPKNRMARAVSEGPWNGDVRTSGKVGRIVRQALHPRIVEHITDSEIESFVNAVGSAASLGTWRLVEGEEIRSWYYERNYRPNSASLSSSCMRYRESQPYFNIYTENPDRVKMLVLIDDERRLRGRALVWCYPDGTFLMDRVYGPDRIIRAFEQEAKQRGWNYRNAKASMYGNARFLTVDGEEYNPGPITLANHRQPAYPYMDSFAWYDPECGIFYPYSPNHNDRILSLHNTNGNDAAVWRERQMRCHRCGATQTYVGTSLPPLAPLNCSCRQCPDCGEWLRRGQTCSCAPCESCGRRGMTYDMREHRYCANCMNRLVFCSLCGDPVVTGGWEHNMFIICDGCLNTSRGEFDARMDRNYRVAVGCGCAACQSMLRDRQAAVAEWERRNA